MLKVVARAVAAIVAAALLVAMVPRPAVAHEGYPIILEAKYQEIKRGANVKRMIFVNGHAHYPNGARIAIGLRLEDQAQYLVWYNGVVKNQSFVAEMGPWNKDFASGLYIVEAWFIWERQSGQIQGAIKKAEEGLERGVDNCDPEIVTERKRCKTKSVFGACVLQVGTPGRFILEEEETRTFLTNVHTRLNELNNDIEATHQVHAATEKGPDVTVDAWRTKMEEWLRGLQEVDEAVVKWHQSKLTVRHQKAYTASVNAVMNLQGLIGVYGQQLYDLPNDFMGGSNVDQARQDVVRQLEELLADLQAQEEGGEEKQPDENQEANKEK